MSKKHNPKGTDEGHAPLAGVSGMLPNGIDLELLAELLKFSDRYEIAVQFWPDRTAVFIYKESVYLGSFGGDFEFTITNSVDYLKRIQPQAKKSKVSQLRYTNIDDRDNGFKERD